jgi:ankyrin repeat protein
MIADVAPWAARWAGRAGRKAIVAISIIAAGTASPTMAQPAPQAGTPPAASTPAPSTPTTPVTPGDKDLALIAAAEKGSLDGVAQAMRAGGSIRATDARGRTPLLAATYGNHVPVALLLIAAGSDVNAKDDQQNSAFLLAGAEGYTDILRLTLRSGADPKSTNRFGGTALIPAAHHGHVDAVRELLKFGVPVDHVNNLGWTALLEAIILGDGGPKHREIVALLVGAKANVNLADRDGVTPLAHAKKRGQAEIVKVLEAAGAK